MVGSKQLHTLINLKKNLRILSVYFNNNHFPDNISRVYHHHLMKTGGTSFNKMFLNLSQDNSNLENLYDLLMNQKDIRLINNNWIYTAWNQLSISSGLWDYGWSHRPIYKTYLPLGTFKITSFRNPYERIFSRYKQLFKLNIEGSIKRNHSNEFKWLEDGSFIKYLENIPQYEMCHQLFMFSKNLDIEEGLYRLKQLNYIIDLNIFTEDVKRINDILDINLIPIHTRKNKVKENVDLIEAFKSVKNRIKPEMNFYQRALEYKYSI